MPSVTGSTTYGATTAIITIGNYQTNGNVTTLQVGISFVFTEQYILNGGPPETLRPESASFNIDWGDGTPPTGWVTVKMSYNDLGAANPIVESHPYVAPTTGTTPFTGTISVPGEYSFSVQTPPYGPFTPGQVTGAGSDFNSTRGAPVVQPFTVAIPSVDTADLGVVNAFSGW
jgi:hypothetical protein